VLLYLTRLAQAANRPDAAERYVKQLLQLSMARALAPLAAARTGQGGGGRVHARFQAVAAADAIAAAPPAAPAA
jgi:hypothetical protein